MDAENLWLPCLILCCGRRKLLKCYSNKVRTQRLGQPILSIANISIKSLSLWLWLLLLLLFSCERNLITIKRLFLILDNYTRKANPVICRWQSALAVCGFNFNRSHIAISPIKISSFKKPRSPCSECSLKRVCVLNLTWNISESEIQYRFGKRVDAANHKTLSKSHKHSHCVGN